jgi:hypothetical protein
MKQKFEILKQDGDKQLIIREYAELDKEDMSLLCEESYGTEAILSALNKGRDALISALRTKNLYPPHLYAAKLADVIQNMFQAEPSQDAVELYFNDVELLAKGDEKVKKPVKIEKEPAELDDLLEDDFEDTYGEDKGNIDKLDSSLKVEDDEYNIDMDEES